MQHAQPCRFFLDPAEFEQEVSVYQDPVLSKALPSLIHATDNRNGAARSRSGFVFPPFFVMERGTTLSRWVAQRTRNVAEVALMLDGMARLLAELHAAGLVHRDIKPANTLHLPNSAVWKLLDVGIVSRAGAYSACMICRSAYCKGSGPWYPCRCLFQKATLQAAQS